MNEIGMLKGINLCRKYNKMNEGERNNLRRERLAAIVSWAKEHSPVYSALYKNERFTQSGRLADLPPVTKAQLMPQFDAWVTDRSVSLADAEEFMKNKDNIGRKFKEKYMVFTTSGSTGNPLVMLCDKTTNNVMSAINMLRAFARKEDLKNFALHGGKSIGVFATDGFYLGNSSIRARQLKRKDRK